MSEPMNPASPKRDEERPRPQSPINTDATFVPDSIVEPSDVSGRSSTEIPGLYVRRDVEDSDGLIDCSATITGMPLSLSENDDAFDDAPQVSEAVPSNGMETIIGADESGESEKVTPESSAELDPEATCVGLVAQEPVDDEPPHVEPAYQAQNDLATFVPQPADVQQQWNSPDATMIGGHAADDDEPQEARGHDESRTVADKSVAASSGGSPTGSQYQRTQQITDPDGSGSASNSGTSRGTQASRGGQSVPGSNVSSQIWSTSANNGLNDLISIRTRPVSGAGQQADLEDADFEIVEKLAEGGMGVVYIARQRSLNRELAIKTLKSDSAAFSGTVGRSNSSKAVSRAERQKREMFLSEALVTANLVHPNIIPIHELAQTTDGMPYYVMKRVHGIPWNSRVREMSLEENLDVMHKVCDAVAFAHHHGVINRDLKPENIMLGEFGEVLVLDWGLAVPAPHAAERNFRSPVASFGAGTPAYMSPELWTGPPEAIGECSDIYLLGAIVFEIVTGKPPHEFPRPAENSARSDFWKIIDTRLRENIISETTESGELLDIAYKAMRTNPDERFGSVLELQFAIRNFQRHEESRRLSRRAAELVTSSVASGVPVASGEPVASGASDKAAAGSDYHTFQTSAALFEESLRMWPQNTEARVGLRETRLRYSSLARSKGDFDLGLQVASQEKDAEFAAIVRQLKSAKQRRAAVKWTALAAMLCVVALGAKSIYDNGIITNLNTEVASRKVEAQQAVETADAARKTALLAANEAQTAKAAAVLAESDAIQSKAQAESAKLDATRALADALTAKQQAAVALADAEKSQKAVTLAEARVKEADKQVAAANENLKMAESKSVAALMLQKDAEAAAQIAQTAAKVAQVEIQSQSIRGLTLTADYAGALREVERLLEGKLLAELPETLREQRTAELKTQRAQLLRRTRRPETPVQTQAVSPDGKWIAFGDASGTVMVLPNPGPMMDWDAEPALQWKSDRPISELRFVDESTIVLTADEHLYVWTLSTEQPSQPSQMHGHSARIQGMDVSGNLLVTGDVSGQIIAWNISERSRLAEMKANTSIRDVALIPGTRDFIFAGARGGQSADVLAYRIPESGNTAMVRLGQLRMTREQNFPPTRVSVSPDGALLVISNSNNGQLFVLPRVGTTDDDRLPGFPFQHPADFTTDQNDQWLVSQHTRPVNDLQWSVDGRHLLTASDDRRIGVWSRSVDRTDGDTNVRSTLKLLQHLQGHGGRVTQAVFLNAAATRISSTSADGYCRLWDLESLDEDSRRIREAFGLTSANRQSRHNIMGAIYLCAAGSEENAAHISPRRSATRAVESNAVEPAESVVLNSNANPHRGTVRSVAFSSDGRQLVSGASDGSIIVWDTQTHQSISGPESVPPTAVSEQFKEGHQFNIARMRLLGSDRTILATAGFDGSLRFWNMNMASGREGVQQQVIGGLGLLNTFAASADGKLLVTTSVRHQSVPANHHTCLWNLQSLMTATHPVPVATLQGTHRGEVTAISVSPDSRFIATGGRDGVVAIWDVKDSQRITSLAAHAKNTIVTSLEWLKDGSLLSAGLDGKLTQWSFAPAVNALASAAVRSENANDSGPAEKPTTQPVFRLTPQTRFTRGRTPIEHIAVSPDQTRMLTVSVVTDRTSKKTTCLLDHWWLNSPATPERINLAAVAGKSPETISSAQWSADGRQVLVCAADCVQVLDSDSWKVVRVFSAGGSGVTDAQFVNPVSGMMPTSEIADAGSKRELVITFDSTDATLWDLADGSPLVSFTGPSPVREVAVLEGTMGRFVLSVGQSLQVFDGGSQNEQFGRPLFHLPQDRSQIAAIAACPVEADLLLTGDEGGQVVLWKWLADQQKLNHEGVIASLTHRVVDVNWSTDGQHIVAVTADGRVHVFRRDGTQPMVIRPAGDVAVELASAQFAPAGQHPREQHLVVTGRIAATLESAGWVLRWREIAAREVAAREVAADNDRETSETGEQNGANSGARATVVCRFSGHEAGGISSASFVPGSPYLVSGGSDGSLILWNWQNPIPAEIPSAYEAYRFLAADQTTAHQGPVSAVAVSRTNAIASCSQDGQIVLWNLPLLQSNTPGNK